MVRFNRVFTILLAIAVILTACLPFSRPLFSPLTLAQQATLPDGSTSTLTMIGRLGGPALAVAVQGNYAYLGHSFELSVLDLTDPTQPKRVAYLPLSANEIVLTPNGRYAYVGGRDGITVVDLAQPTQPHTVGFAPTTVALTGLALDGQWLYATDALGGLWVFACADPLHPLLLHQTRLGQRAENVIVYDQRAYITAYEGLIILDLTDPAHPAPLGATTEPGWSLSAVVAGDYAYVTTMTGVATVDVSAPTNPRQLGLLPLTGYSDGILRHGQQLLLANSAEGLVVVDGRDPNALAVMSKLPLPAYPVDLAGSNGLVYLTDLASGSLHVAAVAQPTAPAAVGLYRAPGRINALTVSQGYAYVIADMDRDLHRIAVTDPANLHDVGFPATPTGAISLAPAEQLLCVATDQPAFQLFDLSDPTQPAGALALANPLRFLRVDGHRAYLVDDAGTVYILDLANGAKPGQLGRYHLYRDVQDAALWGQCILLANGKAGLQIVDVANPLTPRRVGYLEFAAQASHVATEGDMAYLITDDGLLRLLDVTNTLDVQEVGRLSVGAPIHEMIVQGDYLYLAAGATGVLVVDVQQPAVPTLAATYRTPGQARDLVVAGETLYIAADDGGLLLFRLQLP